MSDNLDLWNRVRTPPYEATTPFNRGGGFKGTATSAPYLIRMATAEWGPMGGNWGLRVLSEDMRVGAPLLGADGAVIGNEIVHVVRAALRYPGGEIESFGQTTFVGTNKYGIFTDEEAPKKSLTDALTKALSWLGFAADVHMGLWDDNKYVSEVRQAQAEDHEAAARAAQQRIERAASTLLDELQAAAMDGTTALRNVYTTHKQNPALAQVWATHRASLKAAAEKADADNQPTTEGE